VNGPFGVEHTASPVKSVPTAESRRFDNPADEPGLPLAAAQPPQQVRPLFDECRDYLKLASDLRGQASNICQQVHGSHTVTPRDAWERKDGYA
jgi:hypothetical protein